MPDFSLRHFVFQQHCIPWKVRLVVRRLIPWRVRRVMLKGRANLNDPRRMDERYAHQGDEFTSMENLYDELVKLLPARGCIGDMGCGIGVLLRWIRRARPELELHGQDFSPVAVERTRKYGFDARCAVLPLVAYPDAFFDCIVCTEVIEHLDDPVATLHQFSRALKPGGLLIVSVPDGMGPDHCDEHVQDFTRESLAAVLAEAGFAVRSIDRVVREPYRSHDASFLARATRGDAPPAALGDKREGDA